MDTRFKRAVHAFSNTEYRDPEELARQHERHKGFLFLNAVLRMVCAEHSLIPTILLLHARDLCSTMSVTTNPLFFLHAVLDRLVHFQTLYLIQRNLYSFTNRLLFIYNFYIK